MATCANCQNEASYRHQYATSFGTNYCQYHLPAFLYKARDLGILALPVEAVAEVIEEPVVKTSKKKVVEAVVEPVVEAVAEEPIEEDVVAEETPSEK
jgi:hypothetical protein